MKKKYVIGVVCLVAVLLFVLVDQRNQQALKKQEDQIEETDVRADYDILRAEELEMDRVTDDYRISVKELLERRSDGKEIRGMIRSVGQELTKKKSGKLLIAIAKKNVVKIGNKVKLISEDASLCGSRQLKKLDIGASVKTLQGAWGEFYRAGYVTTKVYFRSKNPPKLTQNNDKNYCYLPIFRDVYVPKASLKKYKKWYKKNDALQFARIKTF